MVSVIGVKSSLPLKAVLLAHECRPAHRDESLGTVLRKDLAIRGAQLDLNTILHSTIK